MRPNSLAFRLFVAAAVWVLVVLPITAFVLISVYRGAVERSFDARLNVYLTDLVADLAAARTDSAAKPPSLTDPLFTRPFSGWYWQITPLGSPTHLLQTSESLLDQRVTLPSEIGITADENLTRHAYMEGPDKHSLRVLEREITLDEGQFGKTRLSFAVSGNGDEIEKTISEFRTLLILALTVLGLGLVLATYFQVRFGLRPLRAIGRGQRRHAEERQAGGATGHGNLHQHALAGAAVGNQQGRHAFRRQPRDCERQVRRVEADPARAIGLRQRQVF